MTHPDAGRPQVHFAAPRGWLNDPNGLVFADGVYHLFYQHHPHSNSWGPMHWGHAISADLVRWEPRPVALAPDERGTIYSGSAVVDLHDTAAFGAGALVAAFTYHRDDEEEQSLAWSHDGGDTFTKLGAPVLTAPAGERDFRDPKVFRHGGPGGHWVMLLAVGRAVWIHTSADLRDWTRTGVVAGVFTDTGTWETPELLRFDVDGEPVWVLTVGVSDGAPAGGSGVQAVAGGFDGERFTPAGDAFWVDHGPAFYAPQAWNDAPGGRRIWIGWMGNWHALGDPPAPDWWGQMSIPREVTVRRTTSGYRLVQTPVPELARHRTSAAEAPAVDVAVHARRGEAIAVACSRTGQRVEVLLDASQRELAVTVEGDATYRAPIEPGTDGTDLRIVLDTTSVEVFAGTATISTLLLSAGTPWSVTVEPDQGSVNRCPPMWGLEVQ